MIAYADAGANCTNLWCDYISTQFDPAHILSELGFSIVFEILQVVVVVWLWRKVVKPRIFAQVHQEIDAEHDITHHGDHLHEGPTWCSEDQQQLDEWLDRDQE